MAAMFLRHEGFLGSVGAFMQVHALRAQSFSGTRALRAKFVERFSMGAQDMGGWVEGGGWAKEGLPPVCSAYCMWDILSSAR
jgi:hypothetical protein